MLRYLVDPIFQVINTAGKPATGGYIEVYDHVTGDKYYCASDFDGTLHPFKIPLDSLGSNIILADDSSTYDIYAYNRYGSLLMSRHNVAVSNSGGGGGEASRKGTIHKIGLWAVDAADPSPKPNEYWILDLESPNDEEPSGYDRLTVEKAREIHNSGSFFGLRTEHVQNPYEDNLLLETYYDYVSMAQTFEVRLSNISGYNEFVEYTLGNFGDYVGVNMYTTSTLLPEDGNGSDVTVTFSEAETRTPISSGSKLSVLMGTIKKWFSDLKALALKDKADLTQDVSGVLPIANGGTNASTAADARTNLDVYSKLEVEALLNGKIVIVASLPVTGDQGKIYYVGPSGSGADQYEEYLWDSDNNQFIKVGERSLDLSGYKTKQTAVTDPTADGNGLTFIDSASQNANGEMTLHKKTVQDASTTQKGVVQLDSVPTANSTNVPTSGGVYSAMRVGKLHRIGVRGVQVSDPSPKPLSDWIIDLESPNANEPDGYDRLTVAKAIELHEAGEIFVFTNFGTASLDTSSCWFYESSVLASSNSITIKLFRNYVSNDVREVQGATLQNFGDYVGVYNWTNAEEFWRATYVTEGSDSLNHNKIHRLRPAYDVVIGETSNYNGWVLDLESPNENAPGGYDRLTPQKLKQILDNGEFLVMETYASGSYVPLAPQALVDVQNQNPLRIRVDFVRQYTSSNLLGFEQMAIYTPIGDETYLQILGIGPDSSWWLDKDALDKKGDGSDVTATFTEAATRNNIVSGSKLSVLFGSIKKWFADIGTAAFKTLVTSWSNTTSNDNIPSEKLVKDSLDSKADKSPTFTEAATVANILRGETLAVMLGKISAWFSAGFPSQEYSTIDITSNAGVITRDVNNNGYTKLHLKPSSNVYLLTIKIIQTLGDPVANAELDIVNDGTQTLTVKVQRLYNSIYPDNLTPMTIGTTQVHVDETLHVSVHGLSWLGSLLDTTP